MRDDHAEQRSSQHPAPAPREPPGPGGTTSPRLTRATPTRGSPPCSTRAPLDLLLAPDTSGVLAAGGRIDGLPVVAFASDATVQGGAMGSEGCEHIVTAYEAAMLAGVPIVGIWHSGGARLREGVESLDAVGRIFAAMTHASGRIPQISVVLGPAAGGAAYGPALTDLVILGPAGRVFVTGPEVVRSVTGEDVDMLRLGGPEPHGRRSGVVHVITDSDRDALDRARELVGLLARPVTPARSRPVEDRDLSALLPESAKRAYDVHPLVDGLLDEPGIELQPKWAPNVTITLGRLGGRTVGVIANNPLRLGGCLDASSAEKAARFVRMCDAFGVPLVVLTDVPGYLPGVGQEWDGVVRRGAKLLHAFAEATVPRVTVVTRKAYGGAYIAMNSRALGRDPRLRLADRRGGGHGRRGRGPHPAPASAQRGPGRPAARAGAAARTRSTSGSPAAWSGRSRWVSSTRWSSPPPPAPRSPPRSLPPWQILRSPAVGTATSRSDSRNRSTTARPWSS